MLHLLHNVTKCTLFSRRAKNAKVDMMKINGLGDEDEEKEGQNLSPSSYEDVETIERRLSISSISSVGSPGGLKSRRLNELVEEQHDLWKSISAKFDSEGRGAQKMVRSKSMSLSSLQQAHMMSSLQAGSLRKRVTNRNAENMSGFSLKRAIRSTKETEQISKRRSSTSDISQFKKNKIEILKAAAANKATDVSLDSVYVLPTNLKFEASVEDKDATHGMEMKRSSLQKRPRRRLWQKKTAPVPDNVSTARSDLAKSSPLISPLHLTDKNSSTAVVEVNKINHHLHMDLHDFPSNVSVRWLITTLYGPVPVALFVSHH